MTEERTVGQLVDDAARDLSDIVRAEIALAKAELKDEATNAAAASVLFAAAGYLGYLATFAGMLTVGFLLAAIGLPIWVSFAVLTLLLGLLAAGLLFVGRAMARRIRPPTRAVEQARATVTQLSQRSSGAGTGPWRRRPRSGFSPRPGTSTGTDAR
jgi:hypothetical protein